MIFYVVSCDVLYRSRIVRAFKKFFQAMLLLVALLLVLGGQAAIADSQKAQNDLDNVSELVEAVIKKMEQDGSLDRVVERSIQRVIQKQQQAQRQAQEQAMQQQRDLAKNADPVDTSTDHIRGNINAEVSLIEFSDFECPFCQRFHKTPAQAIKKYEGKVNWVYRHSPLDFHNPKARQEAIASECVAKLGDNKRFWKYTDALFEYTQSNGKGLPVGPNSPTIESLATDLGINAKQFSACLTDPKMAKIVDDQTQNARQSGVRGTPTTIVKNNKTGVFEVVVGALPLSALETAINKVLN